MGKSHQRKKKSKSTGFKKKGKDQSQSQSERDPPTSQLYESVIKQLKSESSEDRECGLITVSEFTEENVDEALKYPQLLEIIGRLFSDPVVKGAALRAANNLCYKAEKLPKKTDQFIVLPLCNLFLTYTTPWTPNVKRWQESSIYDMKTSTFINAMDLLTSLSLTLPDAVPICNSLGIVKVFKNHLDYQKYGDMVVLQSLQSLANLSDEDTDGIEQINEDNRAILPFLQPMSDKKLHLHMSLVAFKILFNTVEYDAQRVEPAHIHLLIDTLRKILSLDIRKMIHEFSSLAPIPNHPDELDLDEEVSEEEEHALFDIHQTLCATSGAMEVISNLIIDNESNYDLDDEMEKSDEEDDASEPEENVRREPRGFAVAPLAEAFSKYNFAQMILDKTILPADNVIEILTLQGRGHVARSSQDLQYEAFNCFDNLVQELPIEDVGGKEGLFKLWVDLGKKCFTGEGDLSPNTQFINGACKVIRSVTQRFWEDKNGEFFQDLTVEDVQKMIEVATKSTDQEPKVNIVNTVGNIGYLLRGTKPDLMNVVVEFLMETAAKDQCVKVIGEALDSLMDLLAEDDTDDYIAALGLIPRLKQMMPGLKVKIGFHVASPTSCPRVIGFIHEVRKNLMRFIKHKEKSPIIRVALVNVKNSFDK